MPSYSVVFTPGVGYTIGTIPPLAGGGVLPEATLGAGDTPITHAAHVNRPCIINQAGATTGTFAAAATSGAVAGDSFFLRNTGAGTFTAQGAITAPTGMKLTAGPNETFTADYDSVDDAWYSTTLSASAGSSPFTMYAGSNITLPNDTVENTAFTQTIPAGLMGANGWFEYEIYYTRSAAGVGSALARIKFGGTTFDDQHNASNTHLGYVWKRKVYNLGAANAQKFITKFASEPGGDNSYTTAMGTMAIDTSAAADFVFTIQNASAESVTCKVEKWILKVYPKA